MEHRIWFFTHHQSCTALLRLRTPNPLWKTDLILCVYLGCFFSAFLKIAHVFTWWVHRVALVWTIAIQSTMWFSAIWVGTHNLIQPWNYSFDQASSVSLCKLYASYTFQRKTKTLSLMYIFYGTCWEKKVTIKAFINQCHELVTSGRKWPIHNLFQGLAKLFFHCWLISGG